MTTKSIFWLVTTHGPMSTPCPSTKKEELPQNASQEITTTTQVYAVMLNKSKEAFTKTLSLIS